VAAYFLHSSACVKLYLSEAGSPWLFRLVVSGVAGGFYVVRIALVEVAAAIYRRTRATGHSRLDLSTASEAIAELRRGFLNVFQVIEVTPGLCDRAERLAARHFLRGYDCVQLAAALEASAAQQRSGLGSSILVTADRELAAAGQAEGLDVEDPSLR